MKRFDRVRHRNGWEGTIIKVVRRYGEIVAYAIRRDKRPDSYYVSHPSSVKKLPWKERNNHGF